MTEYIMDYKLDVNVGEYVYKRREEIVRCRVCKKLNIVGECPCGFWALEDMKLDGFCAWGEKRI